MQGQHSTSSQQPRQSFAFFVDMIEWIINRSSFLAYWLDHQFMSPNTKAVYQPDEMRRQFALSVAVVGIVGHLMRAIACLPFVPAILTFELATNIFFFVGLLFGFYLLRAKKVTTQFVVLPFCYCHLFIVVLKTCLANYDVFDFGIVPVIFLPMIAHLSCSSRSSNVITFVTAVVLLSGFYFAKASKIENTNTLVALVFGMVAMSQLLRTFVTQLELNCTDDGFSLQTALSASMLEARQASQAKSIFIANISHEFRTPLHAILAAASFLNTAELSKENRVFVNTIMSCGDTLKSLVANVLDLSRIEAELLEWNCAIFDLYALMEEVADNMATVAHAKRLPTVLDMTAQPPFFWQYCYTDRARLKQILSNLIDNAVKFTNTGQIKIRVQCLGYYAGSKEEETVLAPALGCTKPISVANTLEGKELVSGDIIPYGLPRAAKIRFEVIDTGVGIAPSFMQDLFKPFSQSELSALNLKEGAGLGLCISQKFTQAMGGTIQVESELNKGSRFWLDLTFPLSKPPDNFAYLELGQPISCATLFHDLNEQSILGKFYFLSDMTPTGHIVKEQLEKWQFDVETLDQDQLAKVLEERRSHWSTNKPSPTELANVSVETAVAALRNLDVILLDEHQAVLEECLPAIAAENIGQGNFAPVIIFLTQFSQAAKMSRALSSSQRMRVLMVNKPIGPIKLLKTLHQFATMVYSYYENVCEKPRRLYLPNPLQQYLSSESSVMSSALSNIKTSLPRRTTFEKSMPPPLGRSKTMNSSSYSTSSSLNFMGSPAMATLSTSAPSSPAPINTTTTTAAHNVPESKERRRSKPKLQIKTETGDEDQDSAASDGIRADDEASASTDLNWSLNSPDGQSSYPLTPLSAKLHSPLQMTAASNNMDALTSSSSSANEKAAVVTSNNNHNDNSNNNSTSLSKEDDADNSESAEYMDMASLSLVHQQRQQNWDWDDDEPSNSTSLDVKSTSPSEQTPDTPTKFSRRRLPLLIVEDNPINQMILKHLVTKKLGLECEVVEHGRKALEAWSEKDFSLIFMDIQMPVMDGLTATREIRRLQKLEGRAHACIVAMTGLAFKEDREAAMEAGCDEFLSKPVDMEMLQAKIVTWLQQDQIQPQS